MVDRAQFRVELLRPAEQVAVVAVEGEIDIYTAPRLQEVLDEGVASGASRLVVDLSEVLFIDSTGLGVLVRERRRAEARDERIDVVCHRANILRIFKVTGLLDVFSFYATRDEALAAEGAGRAESPGPAESTGPAS